MRRWIPAVLLALASCHPTVAIPAPTPPAPFFPKSHYVGLLGRINVVTEGKEEYAELVLFENCMVEGKESPYYGSQIRGFRVSRDEAKPFKVGDLLRITASGYPIKVLKVERATNFETPEGKENPLIKLPPGDLPRGERIPAPKK